MFLEFMTVNQFKTLYLQLFVTRFTIGNLEMEDNKTDLASSKRSIELYTNMRAINDIIDKNPDKISPYDLVDIAYTVNNEVYDRGFRKTQVDVKKARNFHPIKASRIPEAIYSLFNAYHNIWCDLNVYEREAKLHIELVRMQPFEDGNKRSARILTNFNLLKNNKAPIVIPDSQTEEYFKYIDEYDVESLTKLFKKNSEEELEVMMNLFERICGCIDITNEECEDTDTKLYKYVRNRKEKIND